MSFFCIVFGYFGSACAEFFLMRSALLKDSPTAQFMVRKKQYWFAIILVIFPVSGIFSGVMSSPFDAEILPLDFTVPTGLTTLKALAFGATCAAVLSGLKFKDINESGINSIEGNERSFGIKDAFGWYLSR